MVNVLKTKQERPSAIHTSPKKDSKHKLKEAMRLLKKVGRKEKEPREDSSIEY